jgi:TolB protein
MSLIAWVATVVVLLVAGLVAPEAHATTRVTNGRFTFMRQEHSGFWQVWTSNPDLGAEHKLTSGDADSGWPVWSPDASRIAFDSDRSDPDLSDNNIINDVFSMSADGSDVIKLTDSVGFSGDAAYSPDGRLIAFDANRGVTSGDPGWPSANPDLSIYVMDAADGSGIRRITRPPLGTSDTEPRFSPDGSALVFSRFKGGNHLKYSPRVAGDTSALFVVNLDGTGLHRITGWGANVGQADWSPDGSRIVFENACCSLGPANVYTVSPAGGALTDLTRGHGITGKGNDTSAQDDGFYDPVWSPDGTEVLLGHEFLAEDGSFQVGLAVIDADGTNLHYVAPVVHDEHQPDWGTAPLR